MAETTTTTTTAIKNVTISRIPSGQLTIGEYVTFFISSDSYSCYNASFTWYLNGEIVSTEDTFTTIFEEVCTPTISVEVEEYVDPSWFGGNFYGGDFYGVFSGGTFNYGNLNDCFTISEISIPKKFTSKI